eukprot:s1748_g3.t1
MPTLRSHSEEQVLPRPATALIGRDSNGRFRTAVAKEYPSGMCKGLALAIWAHIVRNTHKLTALAHVLPEIATELANASACAGAAGAGQMPNMMAMPGMEQMMSAMMQQMNQPGMKEMMAAMMGQAPAASQAHELLDANFHSVQGPEDRSNCYDGGYLPTIRQLLAGGAGGSSTTKRKRWNNTTNNASDDNGLAQALVQVLQQWQPQPNWQGNNKKRQKQTPTQPATEMRRPGLREQLLAVLNTKKQASDQEVAGAISAILQPYVAANQHHQHHQAVDHATSYNYEEPQQQEAWTFPSHNHNRWKKSKQTKKPPIPKITSLVASEWTQVPALLDSQALLSKIKAAEGHTDCNISEITQIAEAQQIQSAWKAYGAGGAFCLLLTGQARNMPGATQTRVRLLRNKGIVKVEDVGLLAMGDAKAAIWTKPKINVEATTLPKIDRTTIRVAAPAEFRKAFTDGHDKPRLIVAEMSQWSQDVKAATLVGGTWHHQTANNKELLTGFLNIPTGIAKALVQKSGHRGIFVNIQDKIPNRRPIHWFQRNHNETAEEYHNRCVAASKERQQGLYYRKTRTPHTLGLPPTTAEASTQKPQQFLARGVPQQWHNEELQQFLEGLNWKDVTAKTATISRKRSTTAVAQ